MKLVAFHFQNKEQIGLYWDNKIYPLRQTYQHYLESLGDTLAEGLARARIPDQMVTFIEGGDKALEAAKHALQFIQLREGEGAIESKHVELVAPLLPPIIVYHAEEEFYLKTPYQPCVIANNEKEDKLGIVISKATKYVSEKEAIHSVFGFTRVNSSDCGNGQSIDFIGSSIVTKDEFLKKHTLLIRKIQSLISCYSQFMTLKPGFLIASGIQF